MTKGTYNSKKPKQKTKIENKTSILPPNLQIFKQKLLTGNCFSIYQSTLKMLNY